jgi:hypothetical protein
MSDEKKDIPLSMIIREGMVKKGGLNPEPSTPRPAEPPKGQASQQEKGKKD